MIENINVGFVVKLTERDSKPVCDKFYVVDGKKVMATSSFEDYFFIFSSDGEMHQETFPHYFILDDTLYIFKYTFVGRDYLIRKIEDNSSRLVPNMLKELVRILSRYDALWEGEYRWQHEEIKDLKECNKNLWHWLIFTNIAWLCILFWWW